MKSGLRVAAILHDVGNAPCWAYQEAWGSHVWHTHELVEAAFGEELADMAMRHHSGRSYAEDVKPST